MGKLVMLDTNLHTILLGETTLIVDLRMCSIKPISFSYIIYYCVYCNIHGSDDILNAFIILIHLYPWNTIEWLYWHLTGISTIIKLYINYSIYYKLVCNTIVNLNWALFASNISYMCGYMKIKATKYYEGKYILCELNNNILCVGRLFSYEWRVYKGLYCRPQNWPFL